MAAATKVCIILCAVIVAGMYQAIPAMTQCYPLQPLVMWKATVNFAPVLPCCVSFFFLHLLTTASRSTMTVSST